MLPLEYVNTCRLNAAATLLKNTSRQIVDIAGKTGFPTLSHFNRMFKAYYSCSPWDFRLEHQNAKTPSKAKNEEAFYVENRIKRPPE